MNPRISLGDLVARLESADHTIAYFNKPLPEPLLHGLRLLAGRRGRGSLDLVVEQIDDVAYLKKLNFAGASVYNGVGLPRETLVIVDRIQGYWLATDTDAAGGAPVAADNAPDLYVKLLWRRFGLAVSYEGELKEFILALDFFASGWKNNESCGVVSANHEAMAYRRRAPEFNCSAGSSGTATSWKSWS